MFCHFYRVASFFSPSVTDSKLGSFATSLPGAIAYTCICLELPGMGCYRVSCGSPRHRRDHLQHEDRAKMIKI